MFELLQVRKRKASGPIMGYNFDTLSNTGRYILTPDRNLSVSQQTVPVAVTGYNKSIRLQNAPFSFTPYDFLNAIGADDFTFEFRLYCNLTNTNDYQPILSIPLANSKLFGLQFGDSGFGFRLQVYLNPNAQSTIYATPFTKAMFSNGKFRHVAVVRQAGRLMVFVDGVNNGLAQGTGTSYFTKLAAEDLVTGATAINFGGSAGTAMSMTDFLMSAGAKYTANFTPPVGPLA